MKKIIIILAGATLAAVIAAAERNAIHAPHSSSVPVGIKKSTRLPGQREVRPFESAEAMQAEFYQRFLASPGFGKSRILRPIFLAPTPTLVHNGVHYGVVPPDLIGLEEEPSVYAAQEHAFPGPKTNSETRQLFRSRPMTALETNAVATIRTGRELVVTLIPPSSRAARADHIAPDLLVVGALRASASCAKCHQCAEGQLLGAFTFMLKPISVLPGGTTNSQFTLSRL
jgi:hypothetical protein